jgi:oxygen-independent coproporphyrinogen-3 oxidase
LSLLAATVDAFADAGYRQIGMDHFALPTDEMARALDTHTLHRNFMGYTVKSTSDLVAMGISAIGDVQSAFVQNTKKLPEYYEAIAAGRFPIDRGYALSEDDEIRRFVITELMCNFRLQVADVERRFAIDFDRYFETELAQLAGGEQSPVADGLLEIDDRRLEVQPMGRMFVRNICMVFDRYLAARTGGAKPVFSRTV